MENKYTNEQKKKIAAEVLNGLAQIASRPETKEGNLNTAAFNAQPEVQKAIARFREVGINRKWLFRNGFQIAGLVLTFDTRSADDFMKAKKYYTIGTSGMGYLRARYDEIVAKLGKPSRPRNIDNKVRVEWCFKTRGRKATVITIYDYKDVPPVEQLDTFHIGGKGNRELIAAFLKKYFRDEQVELDPIRTPQEKVVA